MTSFKSAAQNYADYRPRYPSRLIDDLRERTVGSHGEHLVDWGSGTGELALPLSPFFDRVTAIDISAAMVSVAEANGERENVRNIEWRVGRAEDLELPLQSCDLIAAGSAFHWMDRELLARRAFHGLKSGTALALVAGGGRSLREGTAEWSKLAVECLTKHIGEQPRGKNRGAAPRKPHDDLLLSAGFRIESFDYPTEYSWQVDQVVGYLYSIAFPLLHTLGDRRDAFEHEFRDALARTNPSGIFQERFNFNLTIAHKP